jgi:hypothetical protein
MNGTLVTDFSSLSSSPISSTASSPVESVHSVKDDLPQLDLAARVNLQCQRIWGTSKIDVRDAIIMPRYTNFHITVSYEDGTNEFVFHIPMGASNIELKAATYNYIHQELDLKVNTPRVLYKSNSFDEPLGYRFLVFTCLPGQSLQATWPSLSHAQRLSIARQVGELYLNLQTATNSHCGLLKLPVDSYGNTIQGDIFLEVFGQERNHLDNTERDQIDLEEDELVNRENLREDPPGLSARNMAILTFERRKYYSAASRRKWLQDFTDKAVEIFKAITHKDLLDETICIWHRNLSAENIMIERDADGEPKITGLLGWDGAGFAPRFMACRAPQWLWRNKAVRFAPGFDGDSMDTSKEYHEIDEEPFEAFEPNKPEAREIKAAFDEAVGEKFTRAAYDADIIIARRLMYVAACSVWNLDHTQELAVVFAEWNERQGRAKEFKWYVRNMLDRVNFRSRRGSL